MGRISLVGIVAALLPACTGSGNGGEGREGGSETASLGFASKSLQFYRLEVHEEKTLETELVVDPGSAAVTLDAIEIQHDDSKVVEAYELAPASTCRTGIVIEPGGRCTVSLRFAPTKTGGYEADLVAHWNEGDVRIPVMAAARLFCTH